MENKEYDLHQNKRKIMTYPKYSQVNYCLSTFSWLLREFNYLLSLFLVSSFCSLNLQNKISAFNIS